LNEQGILFDFTNIKTIVDALDHHHLNEIEGFPLPSAENIALWIYARLRDFPHTANLSFRVRFYENAVMKESYAEVGDW